MNEVLILESPEKRRDRWRDEARQRWMKLSPFDEQRLLRGHRIYVRDEQLVPDKPGNRTTALYMFFCSEHDIVDIDYEHSYDKRLDCSLCDLHAFPRTVATVEPPELPPLEA